MKSVFAYALVVVGLPNLVGVILSGLCFGVITMRLMSGLSPSWQVRLAPVKDFLAGFVCLFTGVAIFRLLKVQPTVLIPVISCLWSAGYYLNPKYGRTRVAMFTYFVGIVSGWLLI